MTACEIGSLDFCGEADCELSDWLPGNDVGMIPSNKLKCGFTANFQKWKLVAHVLWIKTIISHYCIFKIRLICGLEFGDTLFLRIKN